MVTKNPHQKWKSKASMLHRLPAMPLLPPELSWLWSPGLRFLQGWAGFLPHLYSISFIHGLHLVHKDPSLLWGKWENSAHEDAQFCEQNIWMYWRSTPERVKSNCSKVWMRKKKEVWEFGPEGDSATATWCSQLKHGRAHSNKLS